MIREDDSRQTRRQVVWLVVSICVLAELVGLGLLRAYGASELKPPVISSVGLPTDPTSEISAAFMFTNERTVGFRCALDDEAPRACGVGLFGSTSYPGPLAPGPHTFRVRAVSGTVTSEPAAYAWTIVSLSAGPTPGDGDDEPSDDGRDGAGAGTGESPDGSAEAFEISGDVTGLAPGVTKTIGLALRNPNAEAIYVTRVEVEIAEDSTPPGCASASNVSLVQASGITASSPVLVPANGSVELTTAPRAPRIAFLDQPWNQDVCKGKRFELTYSGSAHS